MTVCALIRLPLIWRLSTSGCGFPPAARRCLSRARPAEQAGPVGTGWGRSADDSAREVRWWWRLLGTVLVVALAGLATPAAGSTMLAAAGAGSVATATTGRAAAAEPPGSGASGVGSGRPVAVAPDTGYGWPLSPPPAVRIPFRAPTYRYGPGHRGVDLAGAPGEPVLAARGGTVVFAGRVAGRGVVSVQHDDGLRTTYEPLVPVVTAGAVVARRAVLGTLEPGHPDCPDPACLHWGVRRGADEYLDPLVLLRSVRVRLLPVSDPWPGGP